MSHRSIFAIAAVVLLAVFSLIAAPGEAWAEEHVVIVTDGPDPQPNVEIVFVIKTGPGANDWTYSDPILTDPDGRATFEETPHSTATIWKVILDSQETPVEPPQSPAVVEYPTLELEWVIE